MEDANMSEITCKPATVKLWKVLCKYGSRGFVYLLLVVGFCELFCLLLVIFILLDYTAHPFLPASHVCILGFQLLHPALTEKHNGTCKWRMFIFKVKVLNVFVFYFEG